MDMLSIDPELYVESTLVDISALPLSELSLWRGPEMCAAMQDAMRRSGVPQVWDDKAQPLGPVGARVMAG